MVIWRYLWASPVSLLGLAVALLSILSGGRVRRHSGVIEVHGGAARWLLQCPMVGAAAMCLGHIVIGQDPECLERTRAHERVHVQQAEILGPLFLPAYLSASLWALICGGHVYWDNWFERDAARRARRTDISKV